MQVVVTSLLSRYDPHPIILEYDHCRFPNTFHHIQFQ